jgi:hypothetical protein
MNISLILKASLVLSYYFSGSSQKNLSNQGKTKIGQQGLIWWQKKSSGKSRGKGKTTGRVNTQKAIGKMSRKD